MDWSMKGARDWMRGEVVLDCEVLGYGIVLGCEMVLDCVIALGCEVSSNESTLSPDNLSLGCNSIVFDNTFPSSFFSSSFFADFS